MSRIIMVKITDPKECIKCGEILRVNDWAQAHGSEGFSCQKCET